MCLALWASALCAQTHFSMDYRQYQYDMTVYFQLALNGGQVVTNTDNYEVAAFVGSECRGVGEFQTATGSNGQTIKYGYLRIYSNMTGGEGITFKAYNKNDEEEINLTPTQTISFEANKAEGLPTSPLFLELPKGEAQFLTGDADGDGRITINDAVLTINATFGTDPTGFNRIAADMDGDGRVTINDAILIINQTF